MNKLPLSLIGCLFSVSTLFSQEIYVSPQANYINQGTKESPARTLTQALQQARESRRLDNPSIKTGITIHL